MGMCHAAPVAAPKTFLPHKDKPVAEPLANEYKEVAWGVKKIGEKVSPFWINRWNCGELDVKIDVKYCGICHTDVVFAGNDVGGGMYPMVPGHEIVGTVTEIGDKVTKVSVGDSVGVGVMVDSCRECTKCKQGEE